MPSQYSHGYTHDLFVSYSSRDADWVRQFVDDLVSDIGRLGVPPVHPYLDKSRLQPGHVWDAALLSAAADAALLLPVLSHTFFQSDYCQKEVSAFIDAFGLQSSLTHRSRVLPIQLLCSAPKDHPLAALQAAAFCTEGLYPMEFHPGTQQYREAIRKLAYSVAEHLRNVPPHAQFHPAIAVLPSPSIGHDSDDKPSSGGVGQGTSAAPTGLDSRRPKTMPIAAAVAFVLLASGGGAYWFINQRQGTGAGCRRAVCRFNPRHRFAAARNRDEHRRCQPTRDKSCRGKDRPGTNENCAGGCPSGATGARRGYSGDAVAGDAVKFRVGHDVLVDDTLVIRKGAPAEGMIVDGAKRRALFPDGKITFRLETVQAVDGTMVNLRATETARPDSKRPVSNGGR